MKRVWIRFRMPIFLVAGGLLWAACGGTVPEWDAQGRRVLTAWAHAGREAERDTLTRQVERFNRIREDVRVQLTFLPEGAYNSQVQAAALSGDLPDLLEFDGPLVHNYVWQNQLRPLDDVLPLKTLERLLPSIREQASAHGHLWSVGQFDSGLGLWADRRALEAVDARIPTRPSEAWTVGEFDTYLQRLAEVDPDGQVLDLKLNYRGEWFTYAFSPALVSGGGGLISRPDPHASEGVLDGAESVEVLQWFQRWRMAGLMDPNVDDNAFVQGRVPLSWVGHWEFDRYHEALGENLVLLPLPDFGRGTRTGQGSWAWGITRSCPDPEAAGAFLSFLLEDRHVLAMTQANGAVPATTTAAVASERYAPGGPLHLFVVQLREGVAVPRPPTPAYPVITSVFQGVFLDIMDGADVQDTLRRAAREIDQDLQDNQGYPAVNPAQETK